MASTAGSLEYLRNYGFITFNEIWDESYDTIEDPKERLIRIADLMKQITTWLPHQRENKIAKARAIAEYNKKLFLITYRVSNKTQSIKAVTNEIIIIGIGGKFPFS